MSETPDAARIMAIGALVSCRLILQYSTDPLERTLAEQTIASAQRVLDAHAATAMTASTG